MTLYNVAIYNYYEFSQLYPNDLCSIELPWSFFQYITGLPVYKLYQIDELQNVLQNN